MARKRLGLSQRAASKAAGLASSHVGAIEAVRLMSIGSSTLRRLATALDVPFAWLAEGDGPIPWDEPEPPAPPDQERYPNRRTAARLLAGLVDPATVDALGTMRLDSDRDLTVAEWVAEARTLQSLRDGVTTMRPAEVDDAPKLPKKRGSQEP